MRAELSVLRGMVLDLSSFVSTLTKFSISVSLRVSLGPHLCVARTQEILRLKGLLEAQPGYEARIESLETLKSELQARLGPAEEQVLSLKEELKAAEDAKKAANQQVRHQTWTHLRTGSCAHPFFARHSG